MPGIRGQLETIKGKWEQYMSCFFSQLLHCPKHTHTHIYGFLSQVQSYSSSTTVTLKSIQLSQFYNGRTENSLGPKYSTGT